VALTLSPWAIVTFSDDGMSAIVATKRSCPTASAIRPLATTRPGRLVVSVTEMSSPTRARTPAVSGDRS
jgi:hypothetical protein